jgi:acetyltransferase-like isoleucine patch superfamily enzyme
MGALSRFDGLTPSANRRASLQVNRRGAAMLVRGLLRRPFLASSGGQLFLGRSARIHNPQFITHTGRLTIEDRAEVQGASRRGVTFGADVSIGPGVQIRPSSFYGGPAGEGLIVGDRSSIGSGGFIGCSGWIEIGDDVMLGPGVRVFSENHVFEDPSRTIKEQGVERGSTVIEDDCWLGSGVTVTSGVRIGRGSVIAAGSVVTNDVPPGSVAGGIPARVLRQRGEIG